VLQQVLESLGAPLAPGRLDRGLQGLDRLALGLDQPLDRGAGITSPAHLRDFLRGLAAEGDDLLDQEARVAQLGLPELPEAVAESLELESEQAPGGDRVVEYRAVLEPEGVVEAADRRLDV
jgi:hypothetical protein